jgi:hypothetical protein
MDKATYELIRGQAFAWFAAGASLEDVVQAVRSAHLDLEAQEKAQKEAESGGGSK